MILQQIQNVLTDRAHLITHYTENARCIGRGHFNQSPPLRICAGTQILSVPCWPRPTVEPCFQQPSHTPHGDTPLLTGPQTYTTAQVPPPSCTLRLSALCTFPWLCSIHSDPASGRGGTGGRSRKQEQHPQVRWVCPVLVDWRNKPAA